MNRRGRQRLLINALLIPAAVAFALPIFWLLILSLRPDAVIVRGVASITSVDFVLDNYVTLFRQFNVLRYLLNSLIGSLVPAVLSVAVALLAGYALVRFEFRGRTFFYVLPLFAQIVPTIQILIPLYVIMLALGLLNTYAAVILAHLSLVLPLSVWMLAGYLRSVPVEIEEAAMVDGCSRVGAVLRVVIPTVLPGVGATLMIAFLETWGEFLIGYVLTSSEDMRLLSVGVVAFLPGAQAPATWGSLFAMAAVFMTPSLALFLLLQRSFARGLSLGAVAGR